jgi:hypothetical protein
MYVHLYRRWFDFFREMRVLISIFIKGYLGKLSPLLGIWPLYFSTAWKHHPKSSFELKSYFECMIASLPYTWMVQSFWIEEASWWSPFLGLVLLDWLHQLWGMVVWPSSSQTNITARNPSLLVLFRGICLLCFSFCLLLWENSY